MEEIIAIVELHGLHKNLAAGVSLAKSIPDVGFWGRKALNKIYSFFNKIHYF